MGEFSDTASQSSLTEGWENCPTALREKGRCKMTEQLKFVSECVTQSGSIR